MVEITLNKVTPFNNGFVIESSTNLVMDTIYYLNIDNNVVDHQYIASKNGTIISDSWINIGYTPVDNSNTCFTLFDAPSGTCSPLICNLQVI